jgi:hypothetical protein
MSVKNKIEPVAISRRNAMFIAAEAQVDLRTVERAYRGEKLKTLTLTRIQEAAKKLKMVEPPKFEGR